MEEENLPVEEVQAEEVTQEETLEVEQPYTETVEETPEPSTEIDEESNQKEEARKHFQERQSRREREEQLQRENEYLKEQLNGGTRQQQPQRQQQQYVDPSEPDLDVFLENGYTAQQFFKSHRQWEKETEQKAFAENEVITSYSQQMLKYSKSVPDVYEYAKEADRLVVPAVQDAILRSSNAPEIIEKIALDPKYAKELNSSRDVFDLARKIAKFENSQPKVKASVSSAPRPPSTPKSEPVITAQTDISKLSHAEYAKYRDAQRNNRR